MHNPETAPSKFVQKTLPWLIASAALLLYLVTLNRWVTLSSLPLVAKVSGWDWSPQLSGPLHFLVTYPIRWFPSAWQPLAMNVLAAVLAAATLGLLARSVALLPHDRTREQRQRERSEFSLLSIPAAWMPLLLAVLVCGLQLTFWEHATAATGEMLDLAIFAYVIRCLLEYRIRHQENWLLRMAFVYGLGVTNNWAMIGFFPFFLAALVWIRGRSFFQWRFIWRMLVCGVAGLSLYLLLPALAMGADSGGSSFLDLLRLQLGRQKDVLLKFPKGRVLILALTSVLPVLVMGVRWPSSFGDTSVVGAMLTNVMFRIVHGMFLIACLWVSFDPAFSPRALGYGYPFLTFYYLSALSIGYFSGYFLLVFSERSGKAWRRPSPAARLVRGAVQLALWAALIAAPAMLVYRNWPRIQAANGSILRQYAELVQASIPDEPAVVLSDDPQQLLLAEAVIPTKAKNRPVLVDTHALPYHLYQRHLQKRFPGQWPDILSQEKLSDPIDSHSLSQLLSYLTYSNRLYYLQPSFGYYFESLYLNPEGLVYRVRPYQTNEITPPPITAEENQLNRKALSQAQTVLAPLAAMVTNKITDALVVGSWYSRALNYWGVQEQRAGHLDQARDAFQRALAFNAENHAAEVNRMYNDYLRTGKAPSFPPGKIVKEILAELRVNGPFDEPETAFRLGELFARPEVAFHRQATLNFLRVQELEPHNLQAAFWLANMYLLAPLPEKVLEITSELRRRHNVRPLQPENFIELIRLEALAELRRNHVAKAEDLLLQTEKQFPNDPNLLETLEHVYWMSGQLTNVIKTLQQELQLFPDNPRALLNLGAVHIQLGHYDQAIPPLDRLLKQDPKHHDGLRNRAIAHLQAGNLDAAEKDYKALVALTPAFYPAYYGLGEIAYRRKNHAEAIKNYELYRKFAPVGDAPEHTKESQLVASRLQELQGASK